MDNPNLPQNSTQLKAKGLVSLAMALQWEHHGAKNLMKHQGA